MSFSPSPPRLFSQIFFFRLRHFSRELAKASLFSLTNVIPSMVYYNSVPANGKWIDVGFGLFKTSCGCTFIKAHYPLEEEWLRAVKQVSMELPVCLMTDESAIFIKEDKVKKIGQIYRMNKGEMSEFTQEEW